MVSLTPQVNQNEIRNLLINLKEMEVQGEMAQWKYKRTEYTWFGSMTMSYLLDTLKTAYCYFPLKTKVRQFYLKINKIELQALNKI